MSQPRGRPPTKVSQLKAAMRGPLAACSAYRIALPRLGEQRDAILGGQEAYVRPRFFKQLGRRGVQPLPLSREKDEAFSRPRRRSAFLKGE